MNGKLNWLNRALKKSPNTQSWINLKEYQICNVLFMGFPPSEEEIKLLFSEEDNLHRLPYDRVLSLVTNKHALEQDDLYIMDMFRALDSDYKGYVDEKDLRSAWKSVAPNLPWEVVAESLQELTANGRIEYGTFKNLCLMYN